MRVQKKRVLNRLWEIADQDNSQNVGALRLIAQATDGFFKDNTILDTRGFITYPTYITIIMLNSKSKFGKIFIPIECIAIIMSYMSIR